MNEYLDSNNSKSSIRLIMIWSMLLASVVILALVFILIYNTITLHPIEWVGMGVFFGSLSTFIGVAIYGKVQQKRTEHYYGEKIQEQEEGSTTKEPEPEEDPRYPEKRK